ncbi:Ankyrin repeat-containing protein [Quillaja saponaria]|uniref:Ankyrin repeat-containing protein n=1 Tax=Quillaja saponaria TaxID=32244 RepID=A0AAD7LV31_QUISA|nr:Ankyrin repeat-containing protein [Quillaja saponaria]
MRNKAGDTVLHEAVRNGHLETVKVLIEKDPDLMTMMTTAGVADAEESPLFVAVDRYYFEIALHIISEAKSEKISISGRNGKNALHAAIIRKVHKSYTDSWFQDLVNVQDSEGNTAMHLASILGHVDIIFLLGQRKRVGKGAVNKAGMTVRDIILLKGRDKRGLFKLALLQRSDLWSSLENVILGSETTKIQNFDQKVKETAVPVPTSEAETSYQVINRYVSQYQR